MSSVRAEDSEPFAALVFKIMTDPFVGQLCFLRVYSGKLSSGDTVLNATKNKRERIGRLVKMHANKREEISEILAGDICAAVGLKTASTGDTICDESAPVVLESIDFPAPVIQLAIEPKTKADQEKLGVAIDKLVQRRSDAEGFHRSRDRSDDSGRHGRAAPRDHRRPHAARVQRRRQRRQAAGRLSRNDPQHAPSTNTRTRSRPAAAVSTPSVKLRVEPHRTDKELRVRERDSRRLDSEGIYLRGGEGRGRVARRRRARRLPAVEREDRRVRRRLSRSRLVAKWRSRSAAPSAAKEAFRKAKPVLLEPVMRVEVVVPDEYMGSVNGDLISRRGRLEGTEILGATHIIKAMVPLSEMFGYATELRSRTQGRGAFTMHFGQYEEVPKSVAEEIISKAQGKVAQVIDSIRRERDNGERKI